MSDDPWKDIKPPDASDSISARRVDSEIPWGFFWARSIDHKCLLVLQYSNESTPDSRIPKMKEIDVSISDYHSSRILVWKLLDSSHRDIFYRLCKDIITSSLNATAEKAAVTIALNRTWRWHHLLRGGGDERLTMEEQKGLIGELFVLERYLLTTLSSLDAVISWCGPVGAPKDFEIGRICIESKARRSAAKPFIKVNSEHQLDNTGTDRLFLYVIELNRAPFDAEDGLSLTDIASRIRSIIEQSDSEALDKYDELLLSNGYQWDHDYSDMKWIEGSSLLYNVMDAFPRICARDLSTGILDVVYSVSLIDCEPFLTTEEDLSAAIRGDRDGN